MLLEGLKMSGNCISLFEILKIILDYNIIIYKKNKIFIQIIENESMLK
jgi:hypothetical protein